MIIVKQSSMPTIIIIPERNAGIKSLTITLVQESMMMNNNIGTGIGTDSKKKAVDNIFLLRESGNGYYSDVNNIFFLRESENGYKFDIIFIINKIIIISENGIEWQ